jgi:hypothetical protein
MRLFQWSKFSYNLIQEIILQKQTMFYISVQVQPEVFRRRSSSSESGKPNGSDSPTTSEGHGPRRSSDGDSRKTDSSKQIHPRQSHQGIHPSFSYSGSRLMWSMIVLSL